MLFAAEAERRPNPAMQYGENLAEWIVRRIPDGMSWRAFALRNGIEPTRMIAWRRGATPTLEQIERLSKALDVPMADVLIGAGVLVEGDLATREVLVPVYDIDKSIRNSPELDADTRKLLQMALKVARKSLAVK